MMIFFFFVVNFVIHWNETAMGLHVFPIPNPPPTTLTTTRDDSTYEHYQEVNTGIRLIIFFAAKDRDTLYNQQKQDKKLTVAQMMSSLLENSDLN